MVFDLYYFITKHSVCSTHKIPMPNAYFSNYVQFPKKHPYFISHFSLSSIFLSFFLFWSCQFNLTSFGWLCSVKFNSLCIIRHLRVVNSFPIPFVLSFKPLSFRRQWFHKQGRQCKLDSKWFRRIEVNEQSKKKKHTHTQNGLCAMPLWWSVRLAKCWILKFLCLKPEIFKFYAMLNGAIVYICSTIQKHSMAVMMVAFVCRGVEWDLSQKKSNYLY